MTELDSSATPPLSVVDALTQRIARRSEPVPILMTPEAIFARLERAIGARMGAKDPRRRRTLAHMVYALMAAPMLTNAELGAAAGLTPQAAQRVADGLVRAGLLDYYYQKNRRYQRLTLDGEQWALSHAKGEAH